MDEPRVEGHPYALSIVTKGCAADVAQITAILEETGWDIKKAEMRVLDPEGLVGNRTAEEDT